MEKIFFWFFFLIEGKSGGKPSNYLVY